MNKLCKQTKINLIRRSSQRSSVSSNKINVANSLLANHLAVSQIFTIIGALTAQNIGFTNFSYTAPTGLEARLLFQ